MPGSEGEGEAACFAREFGALDEFEEEEREEDGDGDEVFGGLISASKQSSEDSDIMVVG